MRQRRSKYGAIRTTIDGITFASRHEARAYQDLKLREKAGEIFDLELQPRFALVVNDVKICDYVADFRFRERHRTFPKVVAASKLITADAKGMKTPVYRLKAKLMKAIHGIEIVEL